MVVSNNFIWLHFPKTAGTLTERVLRKLFGKTRDVCFDKLDQSNIIWHHTIEQRINYDPDFDPTGKALICGFRRLPNWLLSRIYFEYSRNPKKLVTRDMFLKGRFFEAYGRVNSADTYARRYGSNITHWIRTEHLSEDFIATFGQFSQIKPHKIEKYFVKKRNINKIQYIKDISFYFTPLELKRLYEYNPLWTRIEQNVYGDILTI